MRALASILVVATLAGASRAAPDRSAAERIVAAARASGDPDQLAAACKEYVDLYNADPYATDADELAYNSARCYQEAARVGPAIMMYRVLEQHFTSSRLAAPALAQLAQIYERVGMLDRAADTAERYAQRYPAERSAPDALATAIGLRALMSDDAGQLVAAQRYLKAYGAKQPEAAARIWLSLGELKERAGVDEAIAHYRDFLRQFGGKADRTLALRALTRLGELLLRRSCPALDSDGLCLAPAPSAPRPAPASPPTRCGPAPGLALAARSPKLAAEAAATLRAAVRLAAEIPRPDGAALEAHARARLRLADLALEAQLAAALPPEPADRRADARALAVRIADHVALRRSLTEQLARDYEAIAALGDPASELTARSRLGLLHHALVDALRGAAIPPALRAAPGAAGGAAYCEALGALAGPPAKAALAAYDGCLARASALGIAGEPARRCARERARIDPATPAALAELVPAAPAPAPVPPEPAIPALRSQPRPFSDALGAYATAAAATTAGSPALPPARCEELAARFTAVANRLRIADAHYMAGLTYGGCGMAAKAERAYARALDLAPDHAAAISNLGELAWRANRAAEAATRWRAALDKKPLLHGAHLGVAAAALRALRATAAGDPSRPKLDEDARYHASSALALDGADPGPDALLASIALAAPAAARQLPLARFHAARAAAIDDRPLAVALVRAEILERAGRPALGVLEQAARAWPGDERARLALGLLYLRLQRWADARTELAAVATPSYELSIGRGVLARVAGQLADAEARYAEAIALEPGRPEAHFDLGVLWQDHAAPRAPDLAAAAAALDKAAAAFRAAATPEALQRAAACDTARAALAAHRPPAPATPGVIAPPRT